jgi:anti-sigma regulatory factor (Ser/Thr protein kinase)
MAWCPLTDPTLQVAIRNEVAELRVLSDALEQFCVRHRVDSTARVHLQVVLDELASNVIKYAWPDGGTHRIELFLSAVDDGIKLEIVDDGRAFDPRNVIAPAQRTPGNTLGLHLVRQLVDHIDHVRSGGCNHTIVTKLCAVRISPEGAVDG